MLISTIFALFGDPSYIAWQHTRRKSERTLLLKWLRAGEALMRHLLLIEAASYARPNTRPLLRASRKRTRRMMSFEADKPEAWRVSFRCLTPLPGRSATCPPKLEERRRKREEPGPIAQHAAAGEWAPDRRVLAHAGAPSIGRSLNSTQPGHSPNAPKRCCAPSIIPSRTRAAWPPASTPRPTAQHRSHATRQISPTSSIISPRSAKRRRPREGVSKAASPKIAPSSQRKRNTGAMGVT